jgi:hypothetical protein
VHTGDELVSCGNDDIYYSYDDDDSYDDNACNVHDHDSNHAYDAKAVSAGDVHRDKKVTEVGAAD